MTHALTKGIPEKEKKNNVNGSWPHFREVFYISAETGDGVGDIKVLFY